jgi:hypothetical protein
MWRATCRVCGIFTRILQPEDECHVCGCSGDYEIVIDTVD